MGNPKIRMGEFVRDVRQSTHRVSLQRKYRLTESGLGKLFDELIEAGFLTSGDIQRCKEVVPTTDDWTCPACGRSQPVAWDVCPVCGVIVAKFVPRPRITVQEAHRECEITSLGDLLSAARHNLNCLTKDRVLWVVLLVGIVPFMLLISPTNVQIPLFCGLAAIIWAVFFKKLIVADSGGWFAPVSAMFFTGFTGVCLLFTAYFMMPPAYTEMAHSADLLESLKGYVLQVGVCEELCKIAPAIFYVLWKKRRGEPVPPRAVVVIAVFSAIGFSAAENVDYARKAVSHATLCAKKTNPEIVIAGIKGAMVNYLFRSLVLVFLHAVFSGIFGCFLAIGAHTRRLWPVLFLLGLAASAGLHGLYDWTVDRSMLAAATVVWLSFVLFYALSARPRIVLGEHALQMETGEEMKNGAVGRPAVLE